MEPIAWVLGTSLFSSSSDRNFILYSSIWQIKPDLSMRPQRKFLSWAVLPFYVSKLVHQHSVAD